MINALSIDLEYWWSIELLKERIPEKREDLVHESLDPILELLDRNNTKATFFVLGRLAEDYPRIVEDIYERGHEIASHAYSHRILKDLGEDGFEKEIRTSLKVLEKYKPVGFRAPSFSINNDTKWAFRILEENGFMYDSSIFPVKTNLYGNPGVPLGIYRPSRDDVTKNDPEGKILEFPMTVLRKGTNIPISGGFYLRALPLRFLKYGIREVNKERPAVIYIHPWETHAGTPRVDMPVCSRLITYTGIGGAMKKLEALVKEFDFAPLRDVLHEKTQGMESNG